MMARFQISQQLIKCTKICIFRAVCDSIIFSSLLLCCIQTCIRSRQCLSDPNVTPCPDHVAKQASSLRTAPSTRRRVPGEYIDRGTRSHDGKKYPSY